MVSVSPTHAILRWLAQHKARLSIASVLVITLFATAWAAVQQPPPRDTAQVAETLARRYFHEVWNEGKVAVLDELLAPDYINHTPSVGTPGPRTGWPQAYRPGHSTCVSRPAFPDRGCRDRSKRGRDPHNDDRNARRGSLRNACDVSLHQGDADSD